ncbi:hypothetical protein ICE98_02963 [Lactococcus lactis]|nr:hypothetical protein [Lactococcus lactis]
MSENNLPKTQEELNQYLETRLARQKKQLKLILLIMMNSKLKLLHLKQITLHIKQLLKNQSLGNKKKLIMKNKSVVTKQLNSNNLLSIKAGLPLDLADRLSGDDEESLKADAERFSGFIKPKTPPAPLKDVEPNLGDGKDGAYRKLVDGLNRRRIKHGIKQRNII